MSKLILNRYDRSIRVLTPYGIPLCRILHTPQVADDSRSKLLHSYVESTSQSLIRATVTISTRRTQQSHVLVCSHQPFRSPCDQVDSSRFTSLSRVSAATPSTTSSGRRYQRLRHQSSSSSSSSLLLPSQHSPRHSDSAGCCCCDYCRHLCTLILTRSTNTVTALIDILCVRPWHGRTALVDGY